MAMSAADRERATRLLDAIQSDRAQHRLRPGFERDFTNSTLLQWEAIQHLSGRQLSILEDLVQRAGGV